MLKSCNLIVLGVALSTSIAALATPDIQNNNSNSNPTATTTMVEKKQPMEKININTVDEKQLAKTKYIGKKKAKAIVDYRMQNGNFKSLDDLLNIKAKGISKKWLEKISHELTI